MITYTFFFFFFLGGGGAGGFLLFSSYSIISPQELGHLGLRLSVESAGLSNP